MRLGLYSRRSNVNEAHVIEVVHVVSIVGEGTTEDPVHAVHEYFALDGTILARHDEMVDDLDPVERHD